MTSATGEFGAAFAEDQPLITRDALGDDRTGQLLAWASTARIAVVAPASWAAAILAELGPCVADLPGLTKVGQELATASLSGAIALPEHIEDVSTQHQAAASVDAAIAQATGPARHRPAAQRQVRVLSQRRIGETRSCTSPGSGGQAAPWHSCVRSCRWSVKE